MAIIALCDRHLGTPENDVFRNALQTAIECPNCIVLDSGAED